MTCSKEKSNRHMIKASFFPELLRLYKRYTQLKKSNVSILQRGIDKLLVYAYSPFAKKKWKNRTFQLDGNSYHYFIHPYNATWRNERIVEISLALEFLETLNAESIIEIGNVMNYYTVSCTDKIVVDKYEKTSAVINKDLVDFAPPKKFDALISISTLEHIGWDEEPREPEKIISAMNKMRSLLSKQNNAFVTFPMGYNTFLDDLVKTNSLPFRKISFMRRISKSNKWIQCNAADALKNSYDSKYPAANGLFIGRGFIESQ